jgi:ankyrin repeat protein
MMCAATCAWAGTNDVTSLVQKGLFEEEANHNLDAAIEYYRQAMASFDKDRQLAATAAFRLAECYRLQGKTNEASLQYERVLRDFPDQKDLAELSKSHLSGRTSSAPPTGQATVVQELENMAEADEIQKLRDMLKNKPDLINGGQNDVSSPLVDVARNGWVTAAKLLLENGALINPEPGRETPLCAAVLTDNKSMVEFLISKGANPNQAGRQGLTPLSLAVENGYTSVAETLLARGADINAPNSDGSRPLHKAATGGHLAMAQFLLSHGANVNVQDNDGQTPIYKAAYPNHRPEMIRLLAANHGDINLKNSRGRTPLMEALRSHSSVEFLQVLIESGADVNEDANSTFNGDANGALPLGIAAFQNWNEAVRLLIAHHADVNAEDRQGKPALAYQSDPVTRQILLDAGANEDYLRDGGIFVSRKGSGTIGEKVFSRSPSVSNQFTLLDLIATFYAESRQRFPNAFYRFPDLAHITINRLATGGKGEEIGVDIEEELRTGNCGKNPVLQWGDVVMIQECDHKLSEQWHGLSESDSAAIRNCLARHVKIVVKGQTNELTLAADINATFFGNTHYFQTFDLTTVVSRSGLLLLSSDLSHVRLIRKGTPPQVLAFNLEPESNPPDVQLKDGDVIEIPERPGTVAPAQ